MRFEADHAGGMDHPHHHLLLVRREVRKISFSPDGRKGLPVDRRAVGLENVRHQCPPIKMEGSLTMSSRFSPRRMGSSRVDPARTRSKPAPAATRVMACEPEGPQLLAEPEPWSRGAPPMFGARAAARPRV